MQGHLLRASKIDKAGTDIVCVMAQWKLRVSLCQMWINIY